MAQKFICLQAGHQNQAQNCVTSLRSGTGAPGEAEFTVKLRNRLSEILQSKGFMVQMVDATYNCKGENKDFDLFLALHYDANIYGTGGGFIGIPDPSVDDAHAESKRIQQAMISEYFKHSNIVNHPERNNANVTFYYMWKYLTSKTPCVLIECGVGLDAHDAVLLADTNRIANAIARGICKAFNTPFDVVVPPPVIEDPKVKEIEDLKKKLAELQAKYDLEVKSNTIYRSDIKKIKQHIIDLVQPL